MAYLLFEPPVPANKLLQDESEFKVFGLPVAAAVRWFRYLVSDIYEQAYESESSVQSGFFEFDDDDGHDDDDDKGDLGESELFAQSELSARPERARACGARRAALPQRPAGFS